jgi:arsenate reductase
MKKQRVLILCTGNSARSQMAEGILRDMAGEIFDVESAGVAPTSVRPEAVEVMREIGIDISGHLPKSTDVFANEIFDYVITVCDNARESCPVFPGKAERIHWSFDDPADEGQQGRAVKGFSNRPRSDTGEVNGIRGRAKEKEVSHLDFGFGMADCGFEDVRAARSSASGSLSGQPPGRRRYSLNAARSVRASRPRSQ